jgi:hypothetical protein
VAVVLLACFGSRFLGNSGPLYQGQGPAYWFPRWTFELAWSQADELKRAKALGQAGPDALPMLASAAHVEERPALLRYQALRQKVPPEIAQFILPVYRGTEITHFNVAHVLKLMTERDDTLRAIAREWDSFPSWVHGRMLGWLAEGPRQPEVIEPLLFRVLAGPDPALASEAALALCRYPAAGTPRFAEIAEGLAKLTERRLLEDIPPACAELATLVAAQGTNARPAEAVFLKWRESAQLELRAHAALVLPAIAPDRYRLADAVGGLLATNAPMSWGGILGPDRIRRTRQVLPWVELVPVLLPTLTPKGPPAWNPGNVAGVSNTAETAAPPAFNRTARLPVTESRDYCRSAFLELLCELGPEAREALPTLISTMLDDHLAGQRARAIAFIGPVAPETIPSLIPGLSNSATASPLVLLLGAYGPAAKAAIPALEHIATGDAVLTPAPLPLDWDEELKRMARNENLTSRQLTVDAGLTGRLGFTNVWPSPGELGSDPRLRWAADQFATTDPRQRPRLRQEPGTLRMSHARLDRVAEKALGLIRTKAPGP